MIYDLTEAVPLLVSLHRDGHPFILPLAAVYVVWHHHRILIPLPTLIPAVHHIIHDRLGQHGGHHFRHGQVDVLSLACAAAAVQSCEGGIGEHHSDHVIWPAAAQADRGAVGVSGEMTDAGRGLGNRPPAHTMAIRTVLSHG